MILAMPATNNKPTIGKLLKQFSLDSKVSQKEIAHQTGYSPQRVNNYYRDIVEVPEEFLIKFKNIFGVDLQKQLEKENVSNTLALKTNYIPVFDLQTSEIQHDDFFKYSELISYYIDVPIFSDCPYAIRVGTSTMQPDFNPNDIALIQPVKNLDYIIYGEPFFIVCEGMTFVRYIKKHPQDSARSIVLVAADAKYDRINLKRNAIKYLFQITGRITRF